MNRLGSSLLSAFVVAARFCLIWSLNEKSIAKSVQHFCVIIAFCDDCVARGLFSY